MWENFHPSVVHQYVSVHQVKPNEYGFPLSSIITDRLRFGVLTSHSFQAFLYIFQLHVVENRLVVVYSLLADFEARGSEKDI